MKKNLICIILLFVSILVSAQDVSDSAKKVKKEVISSEYDRNAMTIIGLKVDGSFSETIASMIDTLKIEEKYFDNNIGFRIIPYNTSFSLFNKRQQDSLYFNAIPKLLAEKKVGQGIVGKWFNRQADGTFNTEVLKERGAYNSDDSDYLVATASKRGESALMDSGLSLVDRSYVLVLGFLNPMTMQEYYDKIEAEPEARKMNGVKADFVANLYKLDFSDSVSSVFFQNLWLDQNSKETGSRKAKFESTQFPMVPVKTMVMPMQSTQYNPGSPLAPKEQKSQELLIREMVNNSLMNVLDQFTKKVDELKVKAQIYETDPIAIKIGKKEGLKFDHRFFVYENRQTSSGKLYSSRRGVIKSMSVSDNRKVTSGETQPSYFYQIAGKKIDNLGMFVEQRNDAGLNLFLGYAADGLSGAQVRGEYYIGRLLYTGSKTNKISKGLRSLKMYVEGGVDLKEYTIDVIPEDVNLLKVSFGLNKDMYLSRNIHLGPFIGYGIEMNEGKTSKYKVDTDFIETGLRLGINLRYNIQLMASANYYLMLNTEIMDEAGTTIAPSLTPDYDTLFPDRGGFGISYGIRFMF